MRITIHHVTSAYPHLANVPGLAEYVARALMVPSVLAVVYPWEGMEAYLHYLRRIGIGPRQVASADRLYEDSVRGALADRIRALHTSGAHLQFYYGGTDEAEVARELGFVRARVDNARPEFTGPANSKIHLRELAQDLAHPYAVPPNLVCRGETEGLRAFRIVSTANGVTAPTRAALLKLDGLASGDGMQPAFGLEDVRRFCQGLNGHRYIVEALYREREDASISWHLGETGPRPLYFTRQLIDSDGVTHLGNIVATRDLPGLTQRDRDQIHAVTRPFAEYWWREGYRGWMGFDLIGVKSLTGETVWFAVEINARQPASGYAYWTLRQAAPRLGGKAAVVMSNIFPAPGAAQNFDELAELLGDLLFDGRTGALPFIVSLLPKKCAIMCVAKTVAESQGLLARVRARIGEACLD